MGEIIFKTELIKGAKGDRGEAGQADSIPTDGVIAFQGETVPDGYEETDPGDVFDEVYEDINAVKDMIADEYDTTATYNAGDYCTHENVLYKCKTDNTTGIWDATKWDDTTATDETKANAAAIEVIENVTGAKNSLPYPYVDTSKTDADITYTDIGDGTVTVSGAANAPTGFGVSDQNAKKVSDAFPKAGDYIITYKDKDDVFPAGISATIYIQNVYVNVTIPNDGLRVTITDEMMSNKFGMWFAIQSGTAISGTITIKPMIRPAGTDSTYAPYAMTNRELTERFKVLTIPVSSVNIGVGSSHLLYNNPCPTGYIPISAMFDRGSVSNDSVLLTVYLDSGTDVRVNMYNFSNASVELNGSVKVLCIKA